MPDYHPDIPALIEEYQAKYPNGILPRRQLDRLGDLTQALTPGQLTPDTADNLSLLASDTYGHPGRQHIFMQMLQDRGDRETLTSGLRHLLYGRGEVEDRLDEFIADHGA